VESKGLPINSASQAVSQISQCVDEFAIHTLLRQILPALGVESYVYVTLLTNDPLEDRKSHRIFIGCAPQFCQLYGARKWFMIDPYINYSRANSAVICGDELSLKSCGQQDMRKAAANFGFRSLVVVPSHSGSNERFGVLYLGSDRAPEQGNPLIMANRIWLRSIAMELLDWWTVRIKREMMQKLKLTESETTLLQYHRAGYRARDIANELSISLKAVHNRVRIVKEKFDVENIAAAVRLATSYGLLT